jgi:transposase
MANRSHYTEEFKKDAVRLALSRGNRTIAEIAEGLGVSQSMLHRWHQKYAGTARAGAVSAQEEREDVEKLRRRLRELEQENALLKTAAALFAKEVK